MKTAAGVPRKILVQVICSWVEDIGRDWPNPKMDSKMVRTGAGR
jgi:hypothetical protein